MKRGSAVSQVKATNFNAKSYVRPGISEDEILEIKDAFDLYDYEGSGSIKTKRNQNFN